MPRVIPDLPHGSIDIAAGQLTAFFQRGCHDRQAVTRGGTDWRKIDLGNVLL